MCLLCSFSSVLSMDSQSGHVPGLQARSPVGSVWEATTHWCFSPSLSPSLSLSKKYKYNKIFKIYILKISHGLKGQEFGQVSVRKAHLCFTSSQLGWFQWVYNIQDDLSHMSSAFVLVATWFFCVTSHSSYGLLSFGSLVLTFWCRSQFQEDENRGFSSS